MTTQPEALKLADYLESCDLPEAAAEIRRLHEVNQKLLAIIQELIDIEGPQPGTAAWADKARAAIAKATGETT